ncbi:MAG TPA: P1 family peptidase [Gemmatimonadaceae bacterium]|nr:P1 family peptidase [Gemmatimonadaceae bacterium]
MMPIAAAGAASRSSLAVALAALLAMPLTAQSPRQGLTAVDGIKVGQFTLTSRPTGCTVILAEHGAVAGVDVRGAAPGTRETDLLNPINLVQQVNAIVLSGGSAFGLDAASGVMKYLEERNIGYDVRVAKVPIVPAAILFDLNIGDPKIHPDASCGYKAAAAATTGPIAEGDVGAGAGATVGKLAGPGRAMKGGLGTASITLANGLTVAAIVAVNAVGDVIDPSTGKVVAGVRTPDGKSLGDARKLVRDLGARAQGVGRAGENTTIGVVATNATLTKVQATKVAQMAHDGIARAIYPSHTMSDGDAIFALATGAHAGDADVSIIGALAADMMSEAILRAVRASKGLPGYPAVRDLGKP